MCTQYICELDLQVGSDFWKDLEDHRKQAGQYRWRQGPGVASGPGSARLPGFAWEGLTFDGPVAFSFQESAVPESMTQQSEDLWFLVMKEAGLPIATPVTAETTESPRSHTALVVHSWNP